MKEENKLTIDQSVLADSEAKAAILENAVENAENSSENYKEKQGFNYGENIVDYSDSRS